MASIPGLDNQSGDTSKLQRIDITLACGHFSVLSIGILGYNSICVVRFFSSR